MKQSNKVVMECTTVPTHSLNAHSFSWSKSLFFVDHIVLFCFFSPQNLADYCSIISDVAASLDQAQRKIVSFPLHLFGSSPLV